MKVYLCVNRGLGQQILCGKVAREISTSPEIAKELSAYPVYTKKRKSLKKYPQKARGYIRDKLKQKRAREPVMLFLLDIQDTNLIYTSGDRLDPYTTEYYPDKMDTEFSLSIKKIKVDNILSMETWVYFLDKNKRLKWKRASTLIPIIW